MTPLRERGFPNPGQTFTGALHPQTMEVDARVSGSEVPPPGSRYVGITRASTARNASRSSVTATLLEQSTTWSPNAHNKQLTFRKYSRNP